jgi:microcystin-dependent protein
VFDRHAERAKVDRSLEADEGAKKSRADKGDMPAHELVAAWARTTTQCALSALVVALVAATVVALASGDVPVGEVASALSAALGHWQAAKF